MPLPVEFPYNKIRPLMTFEDAYYFKHIKGFDRQTNYIEYSEKQIDDLAKKSVVIPLELTIKEIIKAADNIKTITSGSKKQTKVFEKIHDFIKRGSVRFKKPKTDTEGTVNRVEQLIPSLREMITDSGWVVGPKRKNQVLFTTKDLEKAIPKKGNGLPSNESFVFQIILTKKQLQLMTLVPPGDEKIRDILFDALSDIPNLRQPNRGNEWINFDWYNMNFTKEDFIGIDKDKIKKMLNDEWEEIRRIVEKVETELLNHEKKF